MSTATAVPSPSPALPPDTPGSQPLPLLPRPLHQQQRDLSETALHLHSALLHCPCRIYPEHCSTRGALPLSQPVPLAVPSPEFSHHGSCTAPASAPRHAPRLTMAWMASTVLTSQLKDSTPGCFITAIHISSWLPVANLVAFIILDTVTP